jgi:hypothetical protein
MSDQNKKGDDSAIKRNSEKDVAYKFFKASLNMVYLVLIFTRIINKKDGVVRNKVDLVHLNQQNKYYLNNFKIRRVQMILLTILWII